MFVVVDLLGAWKRLEFSQGARINESNNMNMRKQGKPQSCHCFVQIALYKGRSVRRSARNVHSRNSTVG